MVVGELIKDFPAEDGRESVYPVIQSLKGRRVQLEKRVGAEGESPTFIREEGEIVTAKPLGLMFKPDDDENSRNKPWQPIGADQIDSGQVKVLVEPDLLTPEGLDEVPVATTKQIEMARQYGVDILDVVRRAGQGVLEGMIVKIVEIDRSAESHELTAT